ncbi:MAG TPA: hypothetical protein VHM26_01445 [Chitinophagaceae bacterium]|jgi:hypothetical protein|nr:hypothetical protein [Chitinophagaceae bacterium]
MNKLILAIAFAGLLLSSGCSNKSSPERVLRSFLEKMKEEDFEAAARLTTQNSQEFVGGLKKRKETGTGHRRRVIRRKKWFKN